MWSVCLVMCCARARPGGEVWRVEGGGAAVPSCSLGRPGGFWVSAGRERTHSARRYSDSWSRDNPASSPARREPLSPPLSLSPPPPPPQPPLFSLSLISGELVRTRAVLCGDGACAGPCFLLWDVCSRRAVGSVAGANRSWEF